MAELLALLLEAVGEFWPRDVWPNAPRRKRRRLGRRKRKRRRR